MIQSKSYGNVNGDVIYSHSFAAKIIKQSLFRPNFLATSLPQFESLVTSSSERDIIESFDDNGDVDDEIEVEIEKVSRNRRRIRSKMAFDESLETVWFGDF